MECWHCERPAHATCRFCGRAVCKRHVEEKNKKPFVIDTYRTKHGDLKAIVVANTVWCGICKPQSDPITLHNMED